MQIPASASLLINTIDGILSLSQLDMKALTQKLHLDAVGDVVDSLSGLSIIGIAGGVLILLVLVISMGLRHPKIKGYVERIKLFFMWNFCIRYYQVTFINIHFDSITQLLKSPISFPASLSPALILLLSTAVLITFSYVLLKWPLEKLGLESTKAKIRNLYLNYDTSQRSKTAYGLLFYLLRLLIIAILVTKISYCFQAALLKFCLLFNAVYLFAVRPYKSSKDSVQDCVNAVFLITA